MDNLAISVDEHDKPDSAHAYKKADPPIVLYNRRWVMLAIFSLVSMMNEVLWISLSSVSNIMQEYYRVSSLSINWLAMIFSSMTITIVISVYVINKYGIKITIVTGALCNAIASVFRLIGYKRNGFWLAFIGNVFGGIGQSFLIFIPPTLSAIWFGEGERARATSIGTLMNMLGVAVGFLMGSLFIPNSEKYDSVVKDGVFLTLLIQAIVCGVLLVVSIIFTQNRPLTPSSHSQAMSIKRKEAKKEYNVKSESSGVPQGFIKGTGKELTYTICISRTPEDNPMQSTGLSKNWRMLMTNLTFHVLTQAYSLYFGMFVTVTTLLNQMTINEFPGHEKLIGIMGFTSILAGLIGIMLAGVWLDKTHRYKFISITIFASCVISLLIFTLVLKYSRNFILTFIVFCCYGFCSYPYLSVGLEYIAETMYPIKESILSFILISVGTVYGIVFTSIVGAVLDYGSDVAGYLSAGLYLVGLVCVLFAKGELKRLNVDANVKGNNL